MELGGHTPTPGVAAPAGIPWEERDRWGWFTALWRTVTQSMLSPTDFFRRMAPDKGYGAPILYAIIISVIAALGSMIWMPFFWGMNGIPDEVSDELAILGSGIGFFFFVVMVSIFIVPIAVVFTLFIATAITHLLLMLVAGANRGFEATFRTLAYCHSPTLLEILPFCGGFIAFVWKIVIQIMGLAAVHETTRSRAAFAVLFPIILCGGLLAAFIMFAVYMGTLE